MRSAGIWKKYESRLSSLENANPDSSSRVEEIDAPAETEDAEEEVDESGWEAQKKSLLSQYGESTPSTELNDELATVDNDDQFIDADSDFLKTDEAEMSESAELTGPRNGRVGVAPKTASRKAVPTHSRTRKTLQRFAKS